MKNFCKRSNNKIGGRPRKHFEETKIHSISTTSEGWEGLLDKAKESGINSRSELCDLIGKGKFEILPITELQKKIYEPLGITSLAELIKLIKKNSFLNIPQTFVREFQDKISELSKTYELPIEKSLKSA